jgi:hypothetical protein
MWRSVVSWASLKSLCALNASSILMAQSRSFLLSLVPTEDILFKSAIMKSSLFNETPSTTITAL